MPKKDLIPDAYRTGRWAARAGFLAGAILLLFCSTQVLAQTAQKQEAGDCVIHVLYLGNSYTYYNNLPEIVSRLAKAGHQCQVDARMEAPDGKRLKDHWESAATHEALNSQKWDYVVLQEQSSLGIDYFLEGQPRVTSDEVFFPYAEKWAAEIARHGGRPVFFLTWARKATPEDQAALNYGFMHAGKKTGGIVAPVGLAWQRVRQEKPAMELYQRDGSHPSQAGSYLAACVLYATLYHRSPAGLPSRIMGPRVNLDTEKVEPEKNEVLVNLPRADAEFLQDAAWEAWQSLEKRGGYLTVEPAPVPVPKFARGGPLSQKNLAGTWHGEMLFYPGVGPVQMVLRLSLDEGAWKGHLNITHPGKDFAPESMELEDLRVGEREFSFSDPHSAGVNNARVEFRGALEGARVKGTAEAKVATKSGTTVEVLGDWSLRK
jgi:hypothetical protein